MIARDAVVDVVVVQDRAQQLLLGLDIVRHPGAAAIVCTLGHVARGPARPDRPDFRHLPASSFRAVLPSVPRDLETGINRARCDQANGISLWITCERNYPDRVVGAAGATPSCVNRRSIPASAHRRPIPACHPQAPAGIRGGGPGPRCALASVLRRAPGRADRSGRPRPRSGRPRRNRRHAAPRPARPTRSPARCSLTPASASFGSVSLKMS